MKEIQQDRVVGSQKDQRFLCQADFPRVNDAKREEMMTEILSLQHIWL